MAACCEAGNKPSAAKSWLTEETALRLATSRSPNLLQSSVATNYEPKLYRLQPDRVQTEVRANSEQWNLCWPSLQLRNATVAFGIALAALAANCQCGHCVIQSLGSCFLTNTLSNQPNPRSRVRLQIQRLPVLS